ncbi:hypothetical protein EDD86DRAFT_274356 [Gorgonomyces haynaldii]|nr:hypothetical protein EDD86DRAFT_274356 [Gorgonomyces haynaldii]
MDTFFSLVCLLVSYVEAYTYKQFPGAGATFPAPVYTFWSAAYNIEALNHNAYVNFTYNAIGSTGSGGGQTNILNNVTYYGASDSAISASNLLAGGGNLRMFPVIAGAIVIPYYLPGYTGSTILFARDVLVGIFNGTITHWADPLLQRDNPGLSMYVGNPEAYITVLNGSTDIMSSGLSAFSSAWSSAYGTFSSPTGWPALQRKSGASGNDGMVLNVLKTPFSIGYCESYYATLYGATFGNLKNKAGQSVAPSSNTISAAVSDFESLYYATRSDPNTIFYRIVDGGGNSSYPLTAFSYFIFKTTYPSDCSTLYELYRYVYWIYTSSSANTLANTNGFQTLTSGIRSVSLQLLDRFTCPGDTQSLIRRIIADIKIENLPADCNQYGCENGQCVGRDMCYCDDGWQGDSCDTKIDLIGIGISDPISVPVIILNGATALMSFGCLFWIGSRITDKETHANFPSMTLVMLGGAILVCGGNLFGTSLDDIGGCMAETWLVMIGLSTFLLAFLVKSFYKFKVLSAKVRYGAVNLVSIFNQWRFFGVMSFILFVLILVLQFGAPYSYNLVIATNTDRFYACTSKSSLSRVIMWLLICYFMALATLIAYIVDRFKEPFVWGRSLFGLVFLGFVGTLICVSGILNPFYTRIIRLYVVSVGITIGVGSVVVTLYYYTTYQKDFTEDAPKPLEKSLEPMKKPKMYKFEVKFILNINDKPHDAIVYVFSPVIVLVNTAHKTSQCFNVADTLVQSSDNTVEIQVGITFAAKLIFKSPTSAMDFTNRVGYLAQIVEGVKVQKAEVKQTQTTAKQDVIAW